MWVEPEVGIHALHDHHGAALQLATALAVPGAGALSQGAGVEAEEHVVDQATDGAEQLGVEGEPVPELEGERDDPLPERHARWQHAFDQVGGRLCHSPAEARWTEAPPFAAERDRLDLAALRAHEQRGSTAEQTAVEVAFELVTNEGGQRRGDEAFLGRDVEGLEVVSDDLVERGLVGASPLVANAAAPRERRSGRGG
jgi:hypothetical protein